MARSPQDGVLAVITGIEGPSYRPLGARMAFFPDGKRVGTLSSGCIEADLALHAAAVAESGEPRTIRYGRGSPFIDIRLPCGGGLEILLIPGPDRAFLDQFRQRHIDRVPITLSINARTGQAAFTAPGETGHIMDAEPVFRIHIDPEIAFYIFGKGPEAATFAGLVQGAGYPNWLLSPDEETIAFAEQMGCRTHFLKSAIFPPEYRPDPWSAIVLFFHDHDWEPPILESALASPAFYIGAQGSRRTRDTRLNELRQRGLGEDQLARIRGPIGLIPSARDSRTLAVSVLAEVLEVSIRNRKAASAELAPVAG